MNHLKQIPNIVVGLASVFLLSFFMVLLLTTTISNLAFADIETMCGIQVDTTGMNEVLKFDIHMGELRDFLRIYNPDGSIDVSYPHKCSAKTLSLVEQYVNKITLHKFIPFTNVTLANGLVITEKSDGHQRNYFNNAYDFLGEVNNNSSKPCEFPEVEVTLYSKDNKIMGSYTSYVSTPSNTLMPNQTAMYDVRVGPNDFYNFGDVDSYGIKISCNY